MLTGFMLFFGISYAAETLVPDGDTIQNYIDAASEGDVLILENGGKYQTNELVINKSLTLKAEDGYTTRPILFCNGTSGILFDGSLGNSVTEIGIEFISNGARYLNRINKNDSVHFIGMYDCVARGFDRNFLQAKDSPVALDSVVVEDCYIYAGGGGGYSLINFDDTRLEYMRLTNSSFVTFDKSMIEMHKVPDVAKTVIIENCNIHGRTENSSAPLIQIDGAPGSVFTLKNSIISGIQLEGIWNIGENVTDSILYVFYHEIEDEAGMLTGNTWSYETAFSKEDPLFSNGPAGALYLTAGSPALLASSTGGFIGASRWTVLPPATDLINLVVNNDPSVLSPAFHNDSLNYTGEIPFAFGDTITVDALPVFADTDITGTGKYAWGESLGLSIDVVVAGSKTFHLDLSRVPPNDDPTLDRIVLTDTTEGKYYLFYPADQPGWNEFDLRFPAGMPTIYFEKVDKNFEGTDVSHDAEGDSIDVTGGSGVMHIYCTAESGRSVTYTINMLEEGTGTVTTLRHLMLFSSKDTFTTTPPFQSGISNYSLEVPAGTDTVFVEAISTDSYASISGDGYVDVSSGSGTASITVTSEDGNNNQTYAVEISVVVGLENSFAENQIRLHHHPAVEILEVFNAVEVSKVEIYSITGRLLVSKNVDFQNTLEISTSGLSNGVYVVRLHDAAKEIRAAKFIK